MSLRHIILGLLREPASGYDLKAYFDNSVRYFWAAELSQIYPTLQRMEREGLLSSKVCASTRGPKRRVYSRTPAGRKMLRDWLLGNPRLGDERSGFVAQFFFLDAAGDWLETKRYLTSLRSVLADRLETYARIEREWKGADTGYPDPDGPTGFHQYMALRGGICNLTARIQWCDDVLKEVESRLRRSIPSNGKTSRKKIKKARKGK